MTLIDILNYIDSNFTERHLGKIQEFIKQPSISATGEGVRETAEILLRKIESLGGTNVHLAETMGEEFGHPQVYGEIKSPKNKPTILFYSMYDVQPVYPDKWILNSKKINPFGAEIHEYEWFPGFSGKCLMNRGVMNQKGPTMAAFNVLETFLELEGELPVNLIFAIEGEEELGSPHMLKFIQEYKEQLKSCTAVYFPMFFENYDGQIRFYLGVRGVIEAKLWCRGGSWGGPINRNIHSSSSGLVENPIFRLIEALNSLKNDKNNEILVKGIMDDPKIIGPSSEDLEIIHQLVKNLNFRDLKEAMGVNKFRDIQGKELDGEKAIIEQLFTPGLSINGIEGGYYGEGGMTIIPHEVHANLDIRLPPFQEVDYVKNCYKRHLSENFPMIELIFGPGYGAGKMSPSHPLIQATKTVYKKFNKIPLFYPLLAGSAPFSLFQNKLNLPFVYGGLGHAGRAHSPLEYAVLESHDPRVGGIKEFEKFFATLLVEFHTKLSKN